MKHANVLAAVGLALVLGTASAACTRPMTAERDLSMLSDRDPEVVMQSERFALSGAKAVKALPAERPVRATPDSKVSAAVLTDLETARELRIGKDRINKPVPLPDEPKQ